MSLISIKLKAYNRDLKLSHIIFSHFKCRYTEIDKMLPNYTIQLPFKKISRLRNTQHPSPHPPPVFMLHVAYSFLQTDQFLHCLISNVDNLQTIPFHRQISLHICSFIQGCLYKCSFPDIYVHICEIYIDTSSF